MRTPWTLFIALGSNLGDRHATLRAAALAVGAGALADTTLRRGSTIYECRPLGPARYEFLNAVLEVTTRATAEQVLLDCLALERRYGRERTTHQGPRTLDLDLICGWADGDPVEHSSATLKLPHPRAHRRDFVLTPLSELAGSVAIAGRGCNEWLEALPPEDRTILRAFPHPLLPA